MDEDGARPSGEAESEELPDAEEDAPPQHSERLRLVLSMRHHEFVQDLLELAWAQELQAHAAEQEQLELALARSLDVGEDARPPPPLPPRNSLDRIDDVMPATSFSEVEGFLLTDDDGDAAHECAVCLERLQPAERVRVLPCIHVFHQKCVDKWLARSAACPTCKGGVRLKP